jgi:DNA polymerase-3 subunit gamma/tau
LHHAYLFTGARGVGKTTTARIFAKALNCAKGPTPDPCGSCASCSEIAESRSLDVHEIDAATYTKVEDTREVIISTVGIAPARDQYKIFIIDEFHMMSGHSFNALLKTIEEPPPHVIFILATTNMQKVPETILSRCQIFEFRTITLKRIADQLQHIAASLGVKITETAVAAIARAGCGSMRDAESALDQVISFSSDNISDEDVSAALGLVDAETLNNTIRAVGEQDAERILRIVDEVVTRGYDLRNFSRELITQLRALLVIKVAGFDPELVQMPASEGEHLTQLAGMFSEQDIVRFFAILSKTEQDIRESMQPRFLLEIALIKLLHARRLYLLEDALKQLAELQASLGIRGASSAYDKTNVGPAPTPPPSRSGGIAPSRLMRSAVRKPPAAPPPSLPPEPPWADDPPPEDFYEVGGNQTRQPTATATEPVKRPDSDARKPVDGQSAVHQIIETVASRNRMIIHHALQNADVRIDGDFLVVSLAPEHAADKQQLDPKDKRQFIEEVSREVTGRRLTLALSVGARPPTSKRGAARSDSKAEKPEIPAPLQALVEKFDAEKVEILKPDPTD